MTQEAVENNETLSTQANEQAPEKTTEEQFYGSTEEATNEQVSVEKPEDSEKAGADKVATSEEVQDETGEEVSKEDAGDEWTLELPENTFVTQEGLKELEAFARENKLGKEAASKLLEREDLAVANFINKQDAEMDAEIEQWRESVINDPTIGGENLKATVESARRVVEQFGSEEFTGILRDTGYGDNPEVVKFLSSIGKLISDDSLINPTGKVESKSIEELFYGKN